MNQIAFPVNKRMRVQNSVAEMPFYLPGAPQFAQALQLFLRHTNEYVALHPWYLRLLDSLPQHRAYLDIGTGTGASLTNDADRQFQFGIAVEENTALIGEIRRHCPRAHVINQDWTQVTDQALRRLMAELDPTYPPSDDGLFDLVQLVHVLYYIPQSQHRALLRCLARLVRPGGCLFACLQDETSDYYKLYHQVTPFQYNLRQLGEWFAAEFSQVGWEVSSEILPGGVVTDSFETAQRVAEFMLCYVEFNPLPKQALIEEWVRTAIYQPAIGWYIAQNPQRVLVCRRTNDRF